MKTSEFIQLLEEHPNHSLYFEYQKGKFVRTDYHITEIKNVSYDTVDCGGIQNQWEETHVQLWETELPHPDHQVDTTKALKIFHAVDKVRSLLQETEIKFEYGNVSFPTAILPVHEVAKNRSNLIIQLTPSPTTCKAKDRATSPEEAEEACCGTPVKKKLHLRELNSTSCSQGSGCC
jgi:hypothetical protein